MTHKTHKAGIGRRVLAALLCAAVLIGLVATSVAGIAYASEIDTDRTGSVTFRLDQTPSDYNTAINDLRAWLQSHPDDGLEIRLHRVAGVSGAGKYAAASDFSSLKNLENIGSETKAVEWEAVAADAMKLAAKRTPEYTGKAGYADLTAGMLFEKLPLGLYLVDVVDFNAGNDSYSFVPYLIAVPGYDANGGYLYDAEAGLKPMRSDRPGSLVIRKILPECRAETSGSTFVFEVKAVKNDKVVYNDVHSIVFTEHGIKELRIDGIPAGSAVTVTEIYSGSCYDADSPEKTVTISPDEAVTAEFRNLYGDDAPRNGASAVNHMTVGKNENGSAELVWEKQAASPSVVKR